MGLDMYLEKKIYIGANYKHRNAKVEIKVTVGENPVAINPEKISEITESAAYWRKANAIHKWFVDNVQDGKDDCEQHYVSWLNLQELRDLCVEVLEKKNTEKLPPTSGFFFGSTEIDDGYFEDLKDTIKIIDSLDKDGDYYYRASW